MLVVRPSPTVIRASCRLGHVITGFMLERVPARAECPDAATETSRRLSRSGDADPRTAVDRRALLDLQGNLLKKLRSIQMVNGRVMS